MKKFIVLLLLFPAIAMSASWYTAKEGSVYLLKDRENSELFYQLTSSGGNPRITSVDKKSAGLELIEYNAGDTGTSTIVNTTRRVIYDSVNKKFLGDFPYKLKVVGESDKVAESPVWTIDPVKKTISIKSETDDIDKTIKY